MEAINEAFKEMERIEKVFSKFDEKSEVSKINSLAGIKEINISPEVMKVIEDSLYYSRISEGSFDITVAPLVKIWGFGYKNNTIPDRSMIQEALKHVGRENILIDAEKPSIRFLDKDTKIDLGGIAKGYAVDRVKEVLISKRINNALINLGGNIFGLGAPPGKKGWRIGIQCPRHKNKIIWIVNLRNRAVSTSGDYERFFIVNGKRYSHIISPVTGEPVQGVMSVTVVADSAEASDALSTAIFVMGEKKREDIIKSIKDIEVLVVKEDGSQIKYLY